jgi:hypothetical protein
LESFRLLLGSLSFDHCRLLLLFCSSLLRFRFCSSPCSTCPLCRKQWLWEHFFTCPKLVLIHTGAPAVYLSQFKACVNVADWGTSLSFIRFALLQWSAVLPDVIFPHDVIDSLQL